MLAVDFHKDSFLLSVVIPAYNEVETISAILDRVTYAPFRKEIIVVDDGSTDGMRQILEDARNNSLKSQLSRSQFWEGQNASDRVFCSNRRYHRRAGCGYGIRPE
jgi:glycosyltransferase involved in cell wall biosynthesis